MFYDLPSFVEILSDLQSLKLLFMSLDVCAKTRLFKRDLCFYSIIVFASHLTRHLK